MRRNLDEAITVLGDPDHLEAGRGRRGSIGQTGIPRECGSLPSVGNVDDSYDNALADAADGLFNTEVTRHPSPVTKALGPRP